MEGTCPRLHGEPECWRTHRSARRLMPASVIVGLQWGDEGKGKAVDLLSESVAMVVRYQGGDNAGHTVIVGDEVFKLHLVPSGVLHEHITPVIGNGVVVNPRTLINEMTMLAERGIDVSRVRVSRAAHVIMPYHVALDGAAEAHLSGNEIGTTRRGIGPTYADRAWRAGVRMEDLLDANALRQRLARVLPERNAILHESYGQPGFDLEELVAEGVVWGERLRPHIVDTTNLVQDALAADQYVILEGAQGTLLDLDHGTYPFVTSSNPIAGGACTGGGVGPLQLDHVLGIIKAYSTRVGSGPFPTELDDETGTLPAGEGPRVRHHYRSPASLWLARRRAPALLGRGQQRERPDGQQARHPQRARGAAHRHQLHRRRPAGPLAPAARRSGASASRCTRPSAAGRRTSPAPVAWMTCRPTRSPSSTPSSGSRVRRWPS